MPTDRLVERLLESQIIAVQEQPAITLIMEDGNEIQCGPSKIETRQSYNRDGPEAAATIAELVADVTLWKRLAAERSEQMIDLNLERAAMGVAISRLQEIVARYGDRIAMANAPADLQHTIDDALAAQTALTKVRSAL